MSDYETRQLIAQKQQAVSKRSPICCRVRG